MSGIKRIDRNRSKRCDECGNLFFINKTESIRNFEFFRKYCSHVCVGLANSKRMQGKPNLALKGVRPPNSVIEASRLAHSGKNSHWWKGGVSKVPGYYTHKALERYARLKGAIGTFTLDEWHDLKEKYNHKCAKCGIDESLAKLTKDHIIPLTKGGSNYISNIQPLCQSCNSSKNNKLIYNHG